MGALLALKFAGQDLNVIGIIAIILLIGIVRKNGIMIVDVALKLERETQFAEVTERRSYLEGYGTPVRLTDWMAVGAVVRQPCSPCFA